MPALSATNKLRAVTAGGAAAGQFVVETDGREVRRLAIKGIGLGRLPFAIFLERLCAEARTARSAAYGLMVQHRLR